jgi:integrator complex subunit 2
MKEHVSELLVFLFQVCEAMLHVKHGPWIISRLVANMPDSFTEGKIFSVDWGFCVWIFWVDVLLWINLILDCTTVCYHLISNGEKCEEESDGGLIRLEALKMLCKMNPRQNLLIRSRCVRDIIFKSYKKVIVKWH